MNYNEDGMEMVFLLSGTTIDKKYRLLPNLNVLLPISKDMRAVKLYTNKIVQFLTGGAR